MQTYVDDKGHKVIKPQPGPQTDFCSSPAQIIIYGGAAYGGKFQPLDSLISTPFGFRPMGSMKIGSQISNPDGSVQRVIAIWPQGFKRVWKITCDDGSTCEAGEDHLWVYRIGRDQRKTENQWLVGDTKELIKRLNKGYSAIIPLPEAVQFTLPSHLRNRYPIDPYFLGVLIGDGSLRKHAVNVTSADYEIISRIPVKYSRADQKPGNKAW